MTSGKLTAAMMARGEDTSNQSELFCTLLRVVEPMMDTQAKALDALPDQLPAHVHLLRQAP